MASTYSTKLRRRLAPRRHSPASHSPFLRPSQSPQPPWSQCLGEGRAVPNKCPTLPPPAPCLSTPQRSTRSRPQPLQSSSPRALKLRRSALTSHRQTSQTSSPRIRPAFEPPFLHASSRILILPVAACTGSGQKPHPADQSASTLQQPANMCMISSREEEYIPTREVRVVREAPVARTSRTYYTSSPRRSYAGSTASVVRYPASPRTSYVSTTRRLEAEPVVVVPSRRSSRVIY